MATTERAPQPPGPPAPPGLPSDAGELHRLLDERAAAILADAYANAALLAGVREAEALEREGKLIRVPLEELQRQYGV